MREGRFIRSGVRFLAGAAALLGVESGIAKEPVTNHPERLAETSYEPVAIESAPVSTTLDRAVGTSDDTRDAGPEPVDPEQEDQVHALFAQAPVDEKFLQGADASPEAIDRARRHTRAEELAKHAGEYFFSNKGIRNASIRIEHGDEVGEAISTITVEYTNGRGHERRLDVSISFQNKKEVWKILGSGVNIRGGDFESLDAAFEKEIGE